MEKFNDDEKINICIGDFKWCVYNVHDKASFIMVIKLKHDHNVCTYKMESNNGLKTINIFNEEI